MKFAALLKKELRLCLPWMLLSILAFAGIGAIEMKTTINYQENYIGHGYDESAYYSFNIPINPLDDFAQLLVLTSLSLGVILAVVQFFMPAIHKTWSFTIHRSIQPQMVVWSKFAAALLTFVISMGPLWTLFYLYAAAPGRLYLPVFFETYLRGWIFILMGLIAYWGTALSAVSTTHFYTTRLLGMAIAVAIIVFICLQISLIGAVVCVLAGAGVLILQIMDTFFAREF